MDVDLTDVDTDQNVIELLEAHMTGCDSDMAALTTLMQRAEDDGTTRTGGLEVRGVGLRLESGRTLPDDVSFSGAAGHADRGDRAVGCRQVDAGEGDSRDEPAQPGRGVI